MEPLVSILIPAYNAEAWLANTLQCALSQTWSRKEIIIVNDGSKDQTLSEARKFESRGVKVVTQEHRGAAAARNTAFCHSQGDYIQWLDADDLLSPNKIAEQIDAARQCGDVRKLISGPWGAFRHRPDKAVFTSTALWADLTPVEWLIRKVGQNLHMQTATWLTSRTLTEAAGPWNTQLLVDDDGEYFCRVLLASSGVRFVPGARVFYRIGGTNRLSHIGFSRGKVGAQFVSMELHIGYLRSLEDSQRVRAACVQYLQHCLLIFYPERPDIVEKSKRLAEDLGGKLTKPRLRWKFSWIEKVLGFETAKKVQFVLPDVKSSCVSAWDKLLYRLQR